MVSLATSDDRRSVAYPTVKPNTILMGEVDFFSIHPVSILKSGEDSRAQISRSYSDHQARVVGRVLKTH